MKAPHRCLICGSLNEPYLDRCGCGARLDVTAEASRHAVVRAARLAAAWAILWMIVLVVLAGVTVALATSPGRVRAAQLYVLLFVGFCGALVACGRAIGRFARERANLAAIPDLPRASLRRRP